MTTLDELPTALNRPNNYKSVLFLFLISIIALAVGNTLSLILVKILYGYSSHDVTLLGNSPEEVANGRMALLLNHAIGTIILTFVLAAYLWKRFVEKQSFESYFQFKYDDNTILLIIMAVVITLVSMPLNSFFVYYNKQMSFPSIMSGFEESLRRMEKDAEHMTLFLTDFQSGQEVVVAVIVIGFLTGFGEELLFRGALQNKLFDWFGNRHIAIWVAAIIFSAIHFQFFGFVPRMLLAALFGYMYVWSGNLWVPIIAHAVNNTFTVLMVYYYKNLGLKEEVVNSDQMMPWSIVLISLALTGYLLFYFNRKAYAGSYEV